MNDDDLFYGEREPEKPANGQEQAGAYSYQQGPDDYGYPDGNAPKPVNGFAIASLVTGIISTCCCLCPYASLPCGIAAIVTAILSKKNGRRPTMAYVGLVLGIIGAVIAAAIFVYAFYIASNPDLMNEIMQQYQKLLEDSMNNQM